MTVTMGAMQVYMWDVRFSSGIARHYASHQLDLYLLVLTHLRKTYWTADLQHNLFTEALRAINNGAFSIERAGRDTSQIHQPHIHHEQVQNSEDGSNGTMEVSEAENWMQGSLEDFLHSFNPFQLPTDGFG